MYFPIAKFFLLLDHLSCQHNVMLAGCLPWTMMMMCLWKAWAFMQSGPRLLSGLGTNIACVFAQAVTWSCQVPRVLEALKDYSHVVGGELSHPHVMPYPLVALLLEAESSWPVVEH